LAKTGKICKNSPEWLWNGFALIKGLNQSKTSKKTIFLPFSEANLWQRQENFARIARNGFGMALEWLRNGFGMALL